MTGPLTGLRRQEVMHLLQEAGAATAGSVSGRTTLLVASRDHTRKTRRAASLGVRTIGPGELAELLGYPTLF
jgi:NAD-dependent DNA ligase